MEALTIYQHPITQAPGANMAKPERLPLNILVEKFIYDQDVRERSRSAYRRNIKQFLNWVKDAGLDPFTMKRDHVIAYKEFLAFKGLSPLSISAYITAVRLFYRFLYREGLCWNIAEDVKLPRKPQGHRKQPLSQSEGKALLQYLTRQGPRNEAIGHVLIYCGLRTIEVSRLQVQDLTIRQGKYVLMIHGKGHDIKDRFITVNDRTLQALRAYLATRPGALPGEPMFTSTSNNNRGQQLSTTTISTMIKEALRAIGLDDRMFTAHSLRHTFATSSLKAGAPLDRVSKALGHSSINTTEIYLKTMDDFRRLQDPVTDLINGLYD